MKEKNIVEKETLDLITQIKNKSKDSYHEAGVGAMMFSYKKEQTQADV